MMKEKANQMVVEERMRKTNEEKREGERGRRVGKRREGWTGNPILLDYVSDEQWLDPCNLS